MKHLAKRGISLVLILALVLSLLSVLSMAVGAATVDYVYSDGTSGYIYNWGNRGETATFLSPNAQAFYQDNQTSYAALSQLAGAANKEDVPSSELFAELHDLMYNNLDIWSSYSNAYDASRYLFQYTDCQNSAKTSTKISSFYSGAAIGPQWDSGATWNREHTWPNSKGEKDNENDKKTVREADLMMLRPTSMSENSGRGNTAYGISDGFYDPNSVSNGAYALRGDVARIMLYVYTCWGTSAYEDKCLEYMWGSDGVIESVDVLLDWMEEDPVDTWEMGRNDSVESIYGTRNVFVDYPELAFTLFDEEIPANYATPSNKAVTENTTVTFTQNGNTVSKVTTGVGSAITLPAHSGTVPTGYTFKGWATKTVEETSAEPSFYPTGATYVVNDAVVFYAVYSYVEEVAGVEVWALVKNVSNLAVGDQVVIASPNGAYAMSQNQKSSNRGAVAVTTNGDTISWVDGTTSETKVQVVTLEAGTDSGTFAFNTGGKYLYAPVGSSNQLKTQNTKNAKASWTITITSTGIATVKSIGATGDTARNHMRFNTDLFNCYNSKTNVTTEVSLYKKTVASGGEITYYTTQVSQEAQNSVINLKSVNVDFANSLTLNFNGLKSELEQYEDVYVEFTAAGKTPVRVSQYTPSTSNTDSTTRWNFGFNDLTILDVNLDIYATVYGTKDGVQQIGQTKTYSLLKYCTTAIEAGNDDAELCAYLLKYAMAAEAYKNVDTAKRVETALSANQKAAMEAIFENNAIESATPTQNRVLNNGQQVKFTSQNVDMFSRIAMIFKISLADYTGDTSALSFEINYYDLEWKETKTLTYGFDDLVATDVANVYELSCSGLYAAQMEERITCEIFIEGEAQAHATYENSFENYCYSAINKVGEQETMKTLAKCIYQYGKAASERFAAQS